MSSTGTPAGDFECIIVSDIFRELQIVDAFARFAFDGLGVKHHLQCNGARRP